MRNLFRKILTVSNAGNRTKISSRVLTNDSKEKPKHRVVSFFFTRYVSLVKSCETTFPTAAKFYKTFATGIKGFKNDSLMLFNVYMKLSSTGINCLTRKELEIYHEMPKNIIKVSPFIISAALPFGAALFAVGYIFPRIALSPHFWSEEQKTQFALIDHRKKLGHYKSIICCLESRAKSNKEMTSPNELDSILHGLKSGVKPTIEEIINCKHIFQGSYSLGSLGTIHTGHLLRLHGLHRGWRRKIRLRQFAALIKAMDRAIVIEGGVNQLTCAELKWASFFRGLNPVDMTEEQIKLWLSNWLTVSQEIDETSYSLLLHCPVLLGYNEPSNAALLAK